MTANEIERWIKGTEAQRGKPMADDEREYWREFWRLPKKEQHRIIRQEFENHPETWVKDEQGRYALRSRLEKLGLCGNA
jgi:hypothetical protein